MIVLIDNYDSFTYNLVQALGKLDCDVVVARNDAFDPIETIERRRPDAIVVSPGPGRPEDAGRTIDTIRAAEERSIPLLGVCLGHQAIAAAHGGTVARAPAPRHGKSSRIRYDATGLFRLIVKEERLPADLVVTAKSDDGLVMALAHRERPVYGVQFHPESVLTPEGERLLENFVVSSRSALSR